MLYGVANSIFRPSEFVQSNTAIYSNSRGAIAQYAIQLCIVWALNLTLYALPLTAAGIGFSSQATAPAVFTELTVPLVQLTDSMWQFISTFIRNSVFFTAASAIVLISFHTTVVITNGSRGLMQSFHTVVYTTSAYLAGIFALLMYLSTTDGLSQTREIVLTLQVNTFQAVLDTLGWGVIGIELSLPATTNPGPVTFQGISQTGMILLAVLFLLVLYFVYSVYLGARLNHQMDRTSAIIVATAIVSSPVIYIAGSAAVTILINIYGGQVI